jgi:hypothetical protein
MKKDYFVSYSGTDKNGNSFFGNVAVTCKSEIKNLDGIRDVEKTIRENGDFRTLALISIQKFPI